MNLREILREHGVTYTDGHVENAMKEAIRQALESLHKKLDKEVSKAWDDWDEGYQCGIEFSKREIMSIMDEL